MKQIIVFLITIFFTLSASAEIATIIIKDRKLSINELNFAAKKPVEFKIKNLDKSFEEFESKKLNLEIDALPINSEVTISLPPLAPGRYPFMVEFKGKLLGLLENQVVCGRIIVK